MAEWQHLKSYDLGVSIRIMKGGGSTKAVFDGDEQVTDTTFAMNKAEWQAEGYVKAKREYMEDG